MSDSGPLRLYLYPLKDQFCRLLLYYGTAGRTTLLFDITKNQESWIGMKLVNHCSKLARFSFHCIVDLFFLSPGVSMHNSSGLPSTPASVNGMNPLSLCKVVATETPEKHLLILNSELFNAQLSPSPHRCGLVCTISYLSADS